MANPLIRLFAPSEQSDYIKCRRHERGDFYAFWTRFPSFWSRSFARKDISCHARNPMLDKIVFRQSRFFYFFFSTACFFDIISPMSPQVLESTLSTDPWWSFKQLCFRKDIHLVFSITRRTPVKDAGFI